MRVTSRAIFSGLLFLFFAFFVWQAKDWPPVVRLFPWSIGFPMLIVSLALLIGDLRSSGQANRADQGPVDVHFSAGFDAALVRKRMVTIFCWLVATLVAIWLFGFLIALPAIVFLYTKIQSGEGWTLSFVLTGASWLMLAGLFDRVLHLPFPKGLAFELLAPLF
jgi:Tripartite tricarboxylate transporter TctB family